MLYTVYEGTENEKLGSFDLFNKYRLSMIFYGYIFTFFL